MGYDGTAIAVRQTAGSAADDAYLDVRIVSSAADFDALRPSWSRLHADSDTSVFQSWEWQKTWWKHLGQPAAAHRLHIVVLTQRGDVVAIAPFVVETIAIAPLVKLRRLTFLGAGISDYLDLLVRKGLESTCCERIAALLAEDAGAFDVLSLPDLPDGSRTRGPLVEALRRHGFEGNVFVAEQCCRSLLKTTWNETLDSFHGHHRRQLRWRRRGLEKRFAVELDVCASEERLPDDLEEFMQMHQQRWVRVGRKGVYADQAAAAFQREIAGIFCRRGWLFLAFLKIDGLRVASFCGFRHRGELAVYLTGMRDPGEAGKFSPGIVLHAMCMEAMTGQGVRTYDFLRGVEPYKYKCGAVDVPNWAISMFRGTARFGRLKNVIALLQASLSRRIEQEMLAFRHQRMVHRLLSAAMGRYLRSRLSATVRDGLKKLRAPEKPITLE